MVKDVLRSIDSLGIWGSVAIILFLLVFLYWTAATFLMKSSFRSHMSNLPLEDNLKNKGSENE